MSENIIEKIQQERKALNDLVMQYAGLGTKRFYSLGSQAYREGALPVKTKELLGLVASFVLRCAMTASSTIQLSYHPCITLEPCSYPPCSTFNLASISC